MVFDLKVDTKSIARLFILYSISYIFLLLNTRGIYWDDWSLNQSSEIVKSIFDQAGFIVFGHLHLFLKKIGNGIYIYRLINFFSYFIAGICLYYILQRIRFFDKNQNNLSTVCN